MPVLESFLSPLIISPLLIGALMDALYTIEIDLSVIVLTKLFGKIVRYIENII
jgi:hypothetical protein